MITRGRFDALRVKKLLKADAGGLKMSAGSLKITENRRLSLK
jgi:hypothetical protein